MPLLRLFLGSLPWTTQIMPHGLLFIWGTQLHWKTFIPKFLKGNFVVKKTAHRFSAITTDQPNEQNKTAGRDYRGQVGLSENPAAPRRWIVKASTTSNPFTEYSSNLLALGSRDIASHYWHGASNWEVRRRTVRCLCQRVACQSNKAHFWSHQEEQSSPP